MKKLLVVLGIVVALAVVGLIVAGLAIDSIVKGGITTIGPRITGTPVVLDKVELSLLNGSGRLEGFSVGNPPGWQSDTAFSIGSIHLDLDPASVLKDTIVIDELDVQSPRFVYETKLVSSNIGDLLDQIKQATGGGAETGSVTEGPPKKFIIRRLAIQDGTATLGVSVAALELPLPEIVMTDLGVSQGGITANELAVTIMTRVLADIGPAAARAAGQIGATGGAISTQAVGGAVRKAGDAIKGLFGKDEKEAPAPAEPKR